MGVGLGVQGSPVISVETTVFFVLPLIVVVTVCVALTVLLAMVMLPSLLMVVLTMRDLISGVLVEMEVKLVLRGAPAQGQAKRQILL